MRSLIIMCLAAILLADFLPAVAANEHQLTHAPCGHILTNIGVWSPDGRWIVYDVRSDPAGSVFDGKRIEAVNVETGKIKTLYQSRHGACCGVVTCDPREMKVVFILGPENPTPDWQYDQSHRHGVIVNFAHPGLAVNMDARDLTPPFTPGALRGGTHVHVWDGAGDWISFTYNDALTETDVRDVGIAVPNCSVSVTPDHPRNLDGSYFSVIVTRTVPNPRPGSDEIERASEKAWIGTNGYVRPDGTRQKHALAFQGKVVTAQGKAIEEVFVVDLPDNLVSLAKKQTLESIGERPQPPAGVTQRRLTFTENRKYPGLQGPRHWLRSSPDGTQIAFLMKDDSGVVQLWTISPNGGSPHQVTHNTKCIASAFSWSPDGRFIAHVMDNSVCETEVATGKTIRLTSRTDDMSAPRPEACVFSPDGNQMAYVKRVRMGKSWFNQVFITAAKSASTNIKRLDEK
jgi:WD40 repeat protein